MSLSTALPKQFPRKAVLIAVAQAKYNIKGRQTCTYITFNIVKQWGIPPCRTRRQTPNNPLVYALYGNLEKEGAPRITSVQTLANTQRCIAVCSGIAHILLTPKRNFWRRYEVVQVLCGPRSWADLFQCTAQRTTKLALICPLLPWPWRTRQPDACKVLLVTWQLNTRNQSS